jgi:hypothetical protein
VEGAEEDGELQAAERDEENGGCGQQLRKRKCQWHVSE